MTRISACFGPEGGSQFEGYPLPSSKLGSSLLVVREHFPRLKVLNIADSTACSVK
jgi:hypothetical protein